MAEEIILRLKKKRAVNRSYLTKTCNKIESGLDTLMRIELEELLEQLNESFNELKLVDHEIETLLETDDLEKELQGVEEYREKYITWRFRANKKIRQSDFHGENIPNSNSRIDENEMRHYVPSCTTVKLPKLMISKFYGNFSEWLTFWNSFDAAIHQNNSLNPIDKFNYLKSHLGGTALNTVEGFALSADNYEKAIKLLKDRFGREYILISRHMNNLLSMRPLKTSSDVRTFREIFDNLSVHIRSLESLNVSIDVYGQLLCPIIIKLLPADLNLELNKELPTGYVINDLITFLERQLTAREKSFRNEIGTGNESTSKPNLVNKHPKTRFYNEKPIATASELLNSVHKSNECVFCGKDNHGSPKCDFAANISLNEKRSLMKKKGVCYKCLRPSHLSKFCRNVVRCSICNMSSHLDVMCTKLILDRGGSSKSPTVQDETLANLSTSPDVLLPTLRVTLKGNRTEKTARAIIDTGSQRSYILHSTAMEMEYEQSRREFFRHSLFGGSSTDVVEHEVYTIHLSDINNSYRCEFEALGQPLICGSIPPVCPRSLLEGSEELDVSDLMRDRIEVLIGADIAGRLLTDDQRRISSGLVAIRTKLGWTVMGKIPPTEVRDDISSLCVTTLLSLDLENLWKLDAIGVSDAEVEKKTQSLQAEMEEHFAHTTTRDIEGRYEVALPWVQDKERIPSNKDLAENQLRSVRRKLEEVGDMKEYGQIFEEWMKQGIIEYAREDKLDGVHYLPHRPVYKRNSQTSRIRPVFNASARKRGKLSLNDCLDKGPNLIEIIPRLLNKFRKYEVGVSSDIEKAFLQIGIKEEDRDYLRFLWHTEDGRLNTYRHKRVVFGITTSPYLLKATLSLHLDKAPEHLKITAEQLKSSFHVDNCLSSFQNVEETEKLVKESTELLSTVCFNLRDWVSNVTDFSLMNQLNKEVNILGITWNTDRDTLTIGLEDFELIGPTTKRKVLSIASKIFDPLGVACPVTLIPKLILQETWIQKLTWDEVLPGCLVQRFWKWFSKLKHLPNIEIPRWLCFKDSYVEKTTLHIFCDASQFAYATCIFLRIEKEDRKLTIPRLELLACLIGARLAANVIQDLEFEEIPRFYWTDSTNALCWIQREDNWAAFVMNRVKEIHNLSSPESWRHIPGRLNPADLPSRGCSAESLKETRWWEGPAWLKVSQEEWPKSTIIPDLEIVYSERRKTILNTLCTTRENENLFGRYSHFLRIVRITAWIYRFFNNAKIDRRKIISEDLSTEEITKSEIILIRLIQRESFSGHEDKKLRGFKLLVDSSGILRIKTKICRREDFANFRMPILLPSDHFLVSLLIRWNHETHGHAGLQTLLGILRENYWILRSRKTVKKIINQCIRCKRFTATPATVESTSLPEDRVRDAAVFEIVGVDLTGHLILKNKKKAWIVIFTSFLQAFRRFIARRGRPLIVYSDNGTNFKGIANALKKIDFSRLKCDPTLKNITWKFIPPGAPWWGGWWERLIGMMKQLLFRILGQTSLGYEELSTVMCDVESLMNTRPLTYLTEESEDLAPLTPSLFLHEVREVGVPDLDLIDNQTLSRKYQYIKRVREDLRERFRIEYFGFLRQETRRLKTTIPLKVGDMVLIGQESLKRLHWPLARIIQLYPGKDGLVRVAKVKTSSGDKIRPIQKLYNLEITPEIRCRDPLTERSPTQEVRLTTEEDPLTSQQEQHHIDTPNVVSSYGRPIKRPNRLDLLNFSFPCLSRRDANSKIKVLRTDNALEFKSDNFADLCKRFGIIHEFTAPYVHEQIERIERDNRTIVEAARSMLNSRNLPGFFWAEACNTANYILNRSATKQTPGTTPYELFFGTKPNVANYKIFGCNAYMHIPKENRKKWDNKSIKLMFLGYENTSKNFRLWDWKTRKIRISKDVTFDEKTTLHSDRESTKPKEIIFQINSAPDESPVATANIPVQEMPPVSDISSHPMITRSKVSNSQCNFALADEPSNYIDAITSSDSERCKLAMDEEIDALNKNKTWTLERLADGHKPIGCKWVYKIKTESDGTIQRFKARLVAKGYSQIKNVDYFDTFSPVVRYDSLRILLSHAASERMFLKQFDVKTAFLNGELEELVYLEQPEGYKRDDNSCYRLHKSLYGLKQSSINWNKKFTNFLNSHNFKTSDADPCIFIGTHNDSNVILALYVDDGIIRSKDKEAIAIIMDELEHAFEITSGSVNFFVGLQIEQSEDRASIFIHQSSYIDKILSKFNMADCIPASVPMDPSVILTKQDCPTPEQKEKMPKFPFREAVGSLMFASCVSRPDITYAVSQVSKFLEYPGPAHCTTVKNIFRYLKGTPHKGILFTGQDQLVGYSDSDFARDVDSRKSTTGYAFMMKGGTVSWASQRQPIIALSTTESEYIVACSAAKELIWIRRLLQGIGCDITKETELYIDNQAAIKLVENPVFHKRTKHIDVRYHFIRSKHEEGELKLHHVCSSEQLADIMTKPLPRNQFHYLRGLLNILDREGLLCLINNLLFLDSISNFNTIEEELESLIKHKVWELTELPKDSAPNACKWVLHNKTNAEGQVVRYKARLVAKGFTQQKGIDYDEIYSPVSSFETTRLLTAIGVENNWFIDQYDVKSAYLYGKLDRVIYMEQPEGFVKPGEEHLYCQLKRSLYGLKQSGRCWNKCLDEWLKKKGFMRNPVDPCVYKLKLNEGMIILSLYVDDILTLTENQEVREKCIELLRGHFEAKYIGPVFYLLGVNFTRSNGGCVTLTQRAYIKSLLERFNLQEGREVSTPMETRPELLEEEDEENCQDLPYRELIGGLLYISQRTRPDIAYAVSQLARYCSKYTRKHWVAAKRILRYLKSPEYLGITYRRTGEQLCVYSDADWGTNLEDRKSTSAHAKSYISRSKTRHIAIRYHFVREKVDDGVIQLDYVTSGRNLADILTKPLGRNLHELHCSRLLNGEVIHKEGITSREEIAGP
ncbi:hypothetical protein LAZ67_1000726 [Cordylochernes scorpioides]|uniref:Gag-Pol-p199 n=1 Tax=Cordylochernes scorpioides TaxID=51811 RepID=A0ABY6JY12_9ARAC|nr:hypothetical protein LAZ67_1000726 [Cordylochernes scorpioides]